MLTVPLTDESATEQTRQKMAEISVENLLRGLRGEPLLHPVHP